MDSPNKRMVMGVVALEIPFLPKNQSLGLRYTCGRNSRKCAPKDSDTVAYLRLWSGKNIITKLSLLLKPLAL